ESNHANFSFLPLAKLSRKLKFDCYLSFNFQLSVQLILIKKIFKLNFLIYSRGINTFYQKVAKETSFRYRYFNAILVRWLYKKSDYFIAQSTGMKTDMVNSLGVDVDKIKVIFNPVYGFDNYKPKERVNSESDVKEILFVGALKFQKNIPFLLASIKELSQLRSDFIFRIVGDGSLRNSLEKAMRELEISKFVRFEGFSDNPSIYYKN